MSDCSRWAELTFELVGDLSVQWALLGTRTEVRFFDEIMMVSGLSGSGKSTFIEHFTSGKLTGDLKERLPSANHDWYLLGQGSCLVSSRASLEELLRGIPRTVSRVIIHYDATLLHRLKLTTYEFDPIFGIFEAARHSTLVVMRPSASRILEQFRHRQEQRYSRKPLVNRLWAKYVRFPLNKIVELKLTIRRSAELSTRQLYRNARVVDFYALAWDRFVERFLAQNSGVKVVYIEPYTCKDGTLGFRLGAPPQISGSSELRDVPVDAS